MIQIGGVYTTLCQKGAYLCQSIAIEMGGVSRYFSKVSGSGVDVTLLTCVLSVPNALGKRKAHKVNRNPQDTFRVSLGLPAGQTGVYQTVSQGFPVVYQRQTDRKDTFLPGHRPGVSGTPGRPRAFQKF